MEKISVIGIGRLGLCMALSLAKAGFSVLGVDLDSAYIDSLNAKKFNALEPKVNEYLRSVTTFEATTSLQDGLEYAKLILICVPTPNGGGDDFYDHSILTNLLTRINSQRPSNKDFVVCCTVMPKFCDQVGSALLEDCQNCTLSYNPEFIAQGNIIAGFENPDMILIGEGSKDVGDRLESLYQKVCKSSPRICRMRRLEAEIVKLSVNGFITTKIAYANMIGEACDRTGADAKTVLSAVGSDSRIGSKYFQAGLSYGGPCFPRDTQALSLFLSSTGVSPTIPKATHTSNEEHIDFHVQELLQSGASSFEFKNVCYKEGSTVAIIDESPKLKIAKKLVKLGKTVTIIDTQPLILEVKKKYGNIFKYQLAQTS